MIDTWQLDERCLIACSLRCLCICQAHLKWDTIICCAMNHHLRHVKWQQCGGRGDGVALRHLVKAAAEQFSSRALAQPEPPAHFQVIDARQADDPGERRGRGIELYPLCQLLASKTGIASQPQSKMSTGGVPDGDDVLLIHLWKLE